MVLDNARPFGILAFAMVQDKNSFDRHKSHERRGPDFALGEPDADARRLVDRSPGQLTAVGIAPAEAAVAPGRDRGALGADAPPRGHGPVGVLEEPVIVLRPAR